MATRKTNKLFAVVDCTFPLALFGELFVFSLLRMNHHDGGGGVGGRTAGDCCMHATMQQVQEETSFGASISCQYVSMLLIYCQCVVNMLICC